MLEVPSHYKTNSGLSNKIYALSTEQYALSKDVLDLVTLNRLGLYTVFYRSIYNIIVHVPSNRSQVSSTDTSQHKTTSNKYRVNSVEHRGRDTYEVR